MRRERIEYECDNCAKVFAEGETQEVTIVIDGKSTKLDLCIKDCLPKIAALTRRSNGPVPSLRRRRPAKKAAASPTKKAAAKTT